MGKSLSNNWRGKGRHSETGHTKKACGLWEWECQASRNHSCKWSLWETSLGYLPLFVWGPLER